MNSNCLSSLRKIDKRTGNTIWPTTKKWFPDQETILNFIYIQIVNYAVRRSAHMKKMLTKELSNELKKREGIISITVEPYEKIEVGGIRVDGPAVILINQE